MTMSEMGSIQYGINSRLHIVIEKITECEDIAIETIQMKW